MGDDPYCEDCRPSTRARWKEIQHLLVGDSVLDIGCAHGDGCEFVPEGMRYEGLDANVAGLPFWERYWRPYERERPNRRFFECRIEDWLAWPEMVAQRWGTIVCLETLEHIETGLAIAQRLKIHCDRMLISVPYLGQPGSNGHVLLDLTPEDFPGFRRINDERNHTMFLQWDRKE